MVHSKVLPASPIGRLPPYQHAFPFTLYSYVHHEKIRLPFEWCRKPFCLSCFASQLDRTSRFMQARASGWIVDCSVSSARSPKGKSLEHLNFEESKMAMTWDNRQAKSKGSTQCVSKSLQLCMLILQWLDFALNGSYFLYDNIT